jgi:hypothetical protein
MTFGPNWQFHLHGLNFVAILAGDQEHPKTFHCPVDLPLQFRAGYSVEVLSVSADVTMSVVVGNRRPQLRIVDLSQEDPFIVRLWPTSQPVAALVNRRVHWEPGANPATPLSGSVIRDNLPSSLVLFPDQNLSVEIDLAQAGDLLNSVVLVGRFHHLPNGV